MAKKKKRKGFASANRKNRQRRKTTRKWLDFPAGIQQFKEEADKTVKLDILPYVVKDVKNHPDSKDIPEDLWWKYPYKLHRNIGPDSEEVICPGTIGKPCPICEARQAIYDDPDGDNDDAKSLKASKRGLYVVRPVKGRQAEQIMIWDISDFCFLEKLDVELDDGEEEWEDFAAPEGGYTLKIRFIEKAIGKDTKFAKADRIDFYERGDISEEEIESFPCLDDIITVPSYDQVKAIFNGEEIEEEQEDETDEEIEEIEDEQEKGKEELTWGDLKDMGEDELVDVAADYEIDLKDGLSEDEIRKEIAIELEIEVPEVKERKKRKKKTEKKKEKTEIKCPFKHKFGKDFEETNDCDEDDCKMYEKCYDEYEEKYSE